MTRPWTRSVRAADGETGWHVVDFCATGGTTRIRAGQQFGDTNRLSGPPRAPEAARTCESQHRRRDGRGSERVLPGISPSWEGRCSAVIADRPRWEGLGDLVGRAVALANTVASDPLDYVLGGYIRFWRYTPRLAAHARGTASRGRSRRAGGFSAFAYATVSLFDCGRHLADWPVDLAADQRAQELRDARAVEDVRAASTAGPGCAGQEGVAEDRARGEDVVGGAARVSVLVRGRSWRRGRPP